MCAWPVVLFSHCVFVLWFVIAKCEQIRVKTWPRCLWQWSMQAHACLSCTCIQQHFVVFCFGRFWKSPSQFLGNTKKHIFNTYAFTNAIGLRKKSETWLHHRVPFYFIFFHEDTQVRSLLFVETHPKHLHISPSCDCRWKHIFNTFAFAISVCFICWETHTYLCIIYIHSGNTRAYLCFYWLMKRRHMRVPLFSGLFYWIYSRVSRCSFPHPSTLGQPVFLPGTLRQWYVLATILCSSCQSVPNFLR